MPLFMDIHDKVEELTAEAVAGARQHGVKYLKYWVDEGSGKVIGLVEACSQEAAEAFYRAAHGGIAMVQIRPRPLDSLATGGCKKA